MIPAPDLDAALAAVAARADAWLALSTAEKAALLRVVMARFWDVADDLVADAVAAKGVDVRFAGEDWVTGPISFLRTSRFLADTLEAIAATGRVPFADADIRERHDGQVSVAVMPGDRWDRVLYPGWKADVWMDPAIPLAEARDHLGSHHTKPGSTRPGVVAILGAGNVASIAPLDLVHKLFVDGRVAIVKFSPVNEYIAPHVEHAFAPLVEAGFVRFLRGGADVGAQLVAHPAVDEVHITGSEATHDAIVFGPGADGAARKARNEPLLTKPITSELGNVSPVIVVPGAWSRRQLDGQVRHVVTQVVHNGGYNCNAAKALVLPAAWPQRDEFVEAVAAALAARPDRPAYYPGTAARHEAALVGAPRVRTLGRHGDGFVAPTMAEGFGPASEAPIFTTESFCQLLAVVDLPGDDPGAFLQGAVGFANERLRGTLNVTLLVDPDTARRSTTGLARAVENLRYGSVGVNLWAAAAFPLGVTPWGAFPGHTLDDVQSGIGFVHNARLIDRPQKTVIRAPFTLFPPPPWSVFHRRGAVATRRAAAFEASPGPLRLAAILGPALRP